VLTLFRVFDQLEHVEQTQASLNSMATLESLIREFAPIAEATGVILLAREVWRGHQMEELERQLDYESEMIDLINSGQLLEAREKELMWKGDKPEEAKVRAGRWSTNTLQDWARKTMAGTASAKEVRWVKAVAAEQNETRRRLLLLLGTVLLLFAAGLEEAASVFDKPEPRNDERQRQNETSNLPGRPQSPEQSFFRVEPTIEFGSGEASLIYKEKEKIVDLTSSVCSAKMSLQERQSEIAIVIGRHDQIRLSERALSAYSNNAGLAQRRAEEVARYLRDFTKCGPGIETVIPLSGPPVNLGKASRVDRLLAQDRIVEIYGFGLPRIDAGK
jgi:outer membrane protein OmpA-like peptidoglycan-associated protein